MSDQSKQWVTVPVEPTDDMLYEIQENAHILPPRGRRVWKMLLAAAPKVEREGLTEARIQEIWVEHGLDEDAPEAFARRIEAAHGIAPAHGERKEGE